MYRVGHMVLLSTGHLSHVCQLVINISNYLRAPDRAVSLNERAFLNAPRMFDCF